VQQVAQWPSGRATANCAANNGLPPAHDSRFCVKEVPDRWLPAFVPSHDGFVCASGAPATCGCPGPELGARWLASRVCAPPMRPGIRWPRPPLTRGPTIHPAAVSSSLCGVDPIMRRARGLLAAAVGAGSRHLRFYHPMHASTVYPVVAKTTTSSRWLRNAVIGSVVVGAAALAAAVEEAPISHRKRLMLSSEELEEVIGERHASSMSIKAMDPSHPDCVLVGRVSQRIIVESDRLVSKEAQRWRISVVDSEEVNAFCAPGRVIVVYTGLIRKMEEIRAAIGASAPSLEDMLGVVIAHECGHAIARHWAEKRSWAPFFLFAALFARTSPAIGPMVNVGIHLPMSRVHEDEADHIGMEVLARSCMDLGAPQAYFEHIGSTVTSGWLSTHPTDGSRADRCREHAERLRPLQLRLCEDEQRKKHHARSWLLWPATG